MSGVSDPISVLSRNMGLYSDIIASTVEQINKSSDANAVQTQTTVTAGSGGQLESSIQVMKPDSAQQETISRSLNDLSYWSTLENAYNRIDSLFGSPGDGGVIAGAISDFQTAARYFAENPGEEVRQREFVSRADTLARRLGDFQKSVGDLRKNADASLGDAVNDIAGALKALESSETPAYAVGKAAEADFETQRRKALETLSKYLPIETTLIDRGQYALRSGGVDIFSSGRGSTIAFETHPEIGPNSRYPADLSGVTVTGLDGNTVDITQKLKSGALAALFKLRDDVLPGVVENVMQLADVMRDALNTALNKGASFEARNQLTSIGQYAGTDTLKASGTIVIAITDDTQKIVTKGVVNLANEDMAAVIVKINGVLGADGTAALGADGKLTIKATNAANGVAIHEQTSKVIDRVMTVNVQDSAGVQKSITFDTVTQNVAAMNAAIAADADLAGKVRVIDVNGSFEVEGMNGSFVSLNGASLKASDVLRERGFSHHFGFNDLFVDSSLNISTYFRDHPASIPFGALDTTKNVGEVALTSHGTAISATEARPVDLMRDVFSNTAHFSKTSGKLSRKDSTFFDRVHDLIEAPSSDGNIVRARKEDATIAAKTALQAAGLKLNETQWYMFFMTLNQRFSEQLRITQQVQRNNSMVASLLPAAA